MHSPIIFENIGFTISKKTCFESFNAKVFFQDKICIIGRNGTGKSSLLKILQGLIEASSGNLDIPNDVSLGYVEQVIDNNLELSGAQSFNKSLTEALSLNPNILLLDEPTNHLDIKNRSSLMKFLKNYFGTLLVVSHDLELINNFKTIWHIEDGHITVFNGSYKDYMQELSNQKLAVEKKLTNLKIEKKTQHHILMKEQERAKKKKLYGLKKYDKDKIALKAAQSKGQSTSNKKKKSINLKSKKLSEELSNIKSPERISFKFFLQTDNFKKGNLISIKQGSVGYNSKKMILKDINLSIHAAEKVSIEGDNACGKSTFLKALIQDNSVFRNGDWQVPKLQDIGYLDQHYSNLNSELSVYDHLVKFSSLEIRKHLNYFLFRTNEQVQTLVRDLSGGERLRLSFAIMAAKEPKLIILDEVTNNIDLETKQHLIELLQSYNGSMIVISHDKIFLNNINIQTTYEIKNNFFALKL